VNAFSVPTQIARARFSPCGKHVAAGGVDAKIHVIPLDGPRRALEGHESWIVGLAFAPDGRLFSADQLGGVIAWDVALEKQLGSVKVPDLLRALATDGKRLLAVGDAGVVRVLDDQLRVVIELRGHDSPIYAAAFHKDGSFVSGDLRGDVLHWRDGALVRKLEARPLHTRGQDFLADVGGVRSFAWSPDGRRFAVGGLREAKSNTFCPGTPSVLVYDWESGQRVSTLDTTGPADGPVNALAYAPDGTLYGVAESHGGNAGLYAWKEGPKPASVKEAPSAYDLDLHPDGKRLAIAAYAAKGKGGNGRAASARADYVPNEGAVRLYPC
jgi:WD40 repeat protein